MIDKHAVMPMLTAGVDIGKLARHFKLSRRTIERIRKEPPLEVLRQLRESGTALGESTFHRLYRVEREALPQALMVRFERVPGEFAQFDFGQADVRLLDGRRSKVHSRRIGSSTHAGCRWCWGRTSGSSR
jgi:hypothetical protein